MEDAMLLQSAGCDDQLVLSSISLGTQRSVITWFGMCEQGFGFLETHET